MQSNETWGDLPNWRRPTARAIRFTDLVLDLPGCDAGDLFESLQELRSVTSLHVSEKFSNAIVHFAASDDLNGIFDRVRLDLLDSLHVDQ